MVSTRMRISREGFAFCAQLGKAKSKIKEDIDIETERENTIKKQKNDAAFNIPS